jgi:hypothetical protein
VTWTPVVLGYSSADVQARLPEDRVRRPGLFTRGIAAGLRQAGRATRRTVAGDVYRLSRRIGKHRPLRLGEIGHLLPPLEGPTSASG